MRALRNIDTGIIYGYTEPKAALPHMEEVEIEGEEATQVASAAGDDSPEPTSPDERMKAIITAIKGLDRNNAESFTTTGKPKVPAIEAALGFDITAEERDEAYGAITEG